MGWLMASLPELREPFQAELKQFCRAEPPLTMQELKALASLLDTKGTLDTSKAKCMGKDIRYPRANQRVGFPSAVRVARSLVR